MMTETEQVRQYLRGTAAMLAAGAVPGRLEVVTAFRIVGDEMARHAFAGGTVRWQKLSFERARGDR